ESDARSPQAGWKELREIDRISCEHPQLREPHHRQHPVSLTRRAQRKKDISGHEQAEQKGPKECLPTPPTRGKVSEHKHAKEGSAILKCQTPTTDGVDLMLGSPCQGGRD